jgi:hypothetical protein
MIYLALISFLSQAQPDTTIRAIEPDRETSFENYELLILAILGLLILIGIRFWFKRTRKR